MDRFRRLVLHTSSLCAGSSVEMGGKKNNVIPEKREDPSFLHRIRAQFDYKAPTVSVEDNKELKSKSAVCWVYERLPFGREAYQEW